MDDAFLHEVATLLDSDPLLFPEVDTDALIACGMRSDSESSASNDNDQENADKRAFLREKETKRRRVYRQKLKDERNTLQREVERLTMALASLKEAARKRKTSHVLARDEGEEARSPNIEFWKAVAAWELESLRRVQVEQGRLHTAVGANTKLIKDLRRLMIKRIARTSGMRNGGIDPVAGIQLPDAALYEAFLREVDTNYSRIDEVFRSCSLDAMSEGITNTAIQDPTNGSVKEFLHTNKRLFPFQFLPTCELFWKLATLRHRQHDRQPYKCLEDSNDTIAVKFRVAQVINTGSFVYTTQRLVARRYVETSGMVLVWKIFVEGEGIFRGMHSNESGWCRLRPACEGTWLEMHLRRSPLHYSAALVQQDVAEQFNDFLKISTNEDHLKVMKGLEQLMLDSTI
ncbi:hypothetical protein P3T76_014947 [Phytophthora citrophthora]|uniref:M96 mating-specific protein family n=1 Tax=Phytophthora citrophthora TaxID=4793 RepID=A0AAD9G050_9STRA|nr:hypothetical protein P3T76_014947 [Phytophthora citrophthora]